jgi:glycosyltransferase involved in cell wall biosynthesis
MRKILICSEAHFINSGFGHYYEEVLKRLTALGKYEIAEFAGYGKIQDMLARGKPKWKYYANEVLPNDPRYKEYKSNPLNDFGAWRFERVLLDFQPDIVFCCKDPYMNSYLYDSPFRPYYHLSVMPTVDSIPQKQSWIRNFVSADSVFAYSEWAVDVLKKEGNGKINVIGPASPCIDLDIFKPVADKKAHKKSMGFPEDIILIGSIMRNQKRKLFPDLMEAFVKYLGLCRKNGHDELADKSSLYLHSSYPEARGWDFPELVKHYGIANKVYFTFTCGSCTKSFPGHVRDIRSYCPFCGEFSVVFSNTAIGASRSEMAQIYQLLDVYVQYAIAEGFGIPAMEAAGCGVPVMAVDYSAMADIAKNVGGFPLKVERMFWEIESGAQRALPDNNFTAQALYDLLSAQQDYQLAKSQETAEKAAKRYNWDITIKALDDYFSSVVLKDKQGCWNFQYQIVHPDTNFSQNTSNYDFLVEVYTKIMNKPKLIGSHQFNKYLRDLNNNYATDSERQINVSRELIINTMLDKTRMYNEAELGRMGVFPLTDEDYIRFANVK